MSKRIAVIIVAASVISIAAASTVLAPYRHVAGYMATRGYKPYTGRKGWW